ncbi:MAG: serine/threonine protein kinase bacterial, partial [bacterium]
IFSLNNDSEFQHIAQLFIDRLEKPSRGNNFCSLGSITTKETKLLLDYLSSPESSNNLLEKTQNNTLTSQEKTQLTNLVLVKIPNTTINNQNVTFKVAELGQQLVITKRWRISTQLYLSLSFPDQINNIDTGVSKVLDFSTLLVEGIFSFNLWYYIVLLLPENLSNISNISRFVLKIQDTNTLITLTEEELNKVITVYQASKNSIVSTIEEVLTLLNSLTMNTLGKMTEDITFTPLATKSTNRTTKSHLGSISSYYLEKKLYQSSTTTVYLATQTTLGNRSILLKIISDNVSEMEISNFIKQISVISKIEHPNIIKIYQAGKSHGYYFAAMQYINGTDLASYLKERAFIAPMQLFFLVEQIVDALAYAHENNILHGNIKPSKIIISTSHQAFLSGFINQNPIANTSYLAPEQILNNSLFQQTDVYALGIVVFEALTGHHPFESSYYEEMLSKKLSANTTDMTDVQSLNKLLPKSLNYVFHKALAFDPKARYQTAKELLNALRDCFSSLASEAKDISEFAIVESYTSTNKYYLGLSASNYYLERLLGEGVFSWVYYGVESISLDQRAFKIAKPPELAILPDRLSNRTQEIEFMTGGIRTESPNIYHLLGFQAEKMRKVKDIALVKIDTFVHTNNICYYQMEYIAGQTLRELMNKHNVPVRVIIEIALALDRLSQNPNFRYHGDLKPENIVINNTEIKLIDIG